MPVKNIQTNENDFAIDIEGSGWGTTYVFPIDELATGGSLSRMMNLRVRETLSGGGWRVPADELKAVAKEAVQALRPVVEDYFSTWSI